MKKTTSSALIPAKKELLEYFKAARTLSFAKGEKILIEGQIANSCFYLCKGRVQIIKKIRHKQQARVGLLGEGQFFGEMAMLSGQKRSATVLATTTVEVIEINRREFDKLMHTEIPLAGRIALLFSQQLAARSQKLLKLLEKYSEPDIATDKKKKDPVDVRQVLHKVYSFWAL